LNGFAATSADWDPSFIDGLASSNELILVDNRGIGSSSDNGKPFDIAELANDAAHIVETLGFERTSVLGWSMGGFVAQTLALQHPDRVNKLILLSTDQGSADADRASTAVVAAARARLAPDLIKRQAAAMDAWHQNGVRGQLREISAPELIATGTEDVVIPASNALKLVNAIPGAWLAQFPGAGHAFTAQYPRPLADLINTFLALG
jgi:pimeloyl-ACP methyl ester carboxylesterase